MLRPDIGSDVCRMGNVQYSIHAKTYHPKLYQRWYNIVQIKKALKGLKFNVVNDPPDAGTFNSVSFNIPCHCNACVKKCEQR